MELDVIYSEDCLEGMKRLPGESVDLVVTDPPFGIAFMGKDWDKAVPPVAIWKESLRVLKSGAFAFVMCIPRQDCLSRMVVNLEDVGFNVSFSPIFHTFATGFPKAGNVSKMLDRRFGVEREVIGDIVRLGDKKAYPTNHSHGFYVGNKEDGRKITISASPEAKALDGSYCGFQPKPAVEVVLVAMKPLTEKSYIDQAMENRKGCTWLDDGRIPHSEPIKKAERIQGARHGSSLHLNESNATWQEGTMASPSPQGRFPANLLVSDDVLNDGLVTVSQRIMKQCVYKGDPGAFGNTGNRPARGYSDSGSYSRYFSLDAWWEERIKQLPESVQKTFPFMIVPKASKKEKGEGNTHPTVKPIKLMSYLITIGSREGDVILDPFLGSGTTAIAAKMLNRRFIGMEIDAEYCEIAEQRIAAVEMAEEPDLFSEAAQ